MRCSCYEKKILILIQKFWNRNQNEIIKSIIDTRQNYKTKEEQDEQKEKASVTIRVPLGIGIIYWCIGIFLLRWVKRESFFIIGIELIILGTYALLFSLIFYCEKEQWKEGIRILLVFLMLPYHVCIKKIKKFIKDSRQEHVIYLFPYYFLSIFFVALSFVMIVTFLPIVHINDVYREAENFLIVFF